MTPSRKALAAKVIDLWNAGGRSASDIARDLGIGSRNAVIGLLYRARAKGVYVETKVRTAPIEKRKRVRERRMKTVPKLRLSPPPVEPAPVIPVVMLGLSIMGLKRTSCRFIADDGTYCGLKALHKSYCPDHATVVYQPRRDEHDASRR